MNMSMDYGWGKYCTLIVASAYNLQIGTFGINNLNGFKSQSWYAPLHMLEQLSFQQDLRLKSRREDWALIAYFLGGQV
jgi:hypothetical protein